jgi:hypothetical protein
MLETSEYLYTCNPCIGLGLISLELLFVYFLGKIIILFLYSIFGASTVSGK